MTMITGTADFGKTATTTAAAKLAAKALGLALLGAACLAVHSTVEHSANSRSQGHTAVMADDWPRSAVQGSASGN
jgi:hypothetical protein